MPRRINRSSNLRGSHGSPAIRRVLRSTAPRALLIVALSAVGGEAIAEYGRGGHGQPPRRVPDNPIFRTLDVVAGGLDLAVEKSLVSRNWVAQRFSGRYPQRACDDLPCDAMGPEGPTSSGSWDGRLVPCDDRCDPRHLNALPGNSRVSPFALDTLAPSARSTPRRPSPPVGPQTDDYPTSPPRPSQMPQAATPPESRGPEQELQPLPDESSQPGPRPTAPPEDADWFDEFSPSIPPIRPTAPVRPKTSDPFQDDVSQDDGTLKPLRNLQSPSPSAHPVSKPVPAKRPTTQARPVNTRDTLLLAPANGGNR